MRQLTIALIISSLALTACGGLQTRRIVITQEYQQAVSLEELASPQMNLRLSHPYVLDLLIANEVMRNLRYLGTSTLSSEPTQLPVFQEDEIERLAPALVNALSLAQEQQYVRFVSFSQGKGIFFKTSQKTEGIVFISSEGQLNFAFNYIHSKRGGSETTAMYHEYSKLNPLKMTTSKTPLIATEPGLAMHTLADGAPSPTWIVANLAAVTRKSDHQAVPEPIQLRKPVQTDKINQTVALTSTSNQPKAQSSDETQMLTIKKKLEFLKNLFDEGLISQEEYQTRKKIVLDRI